MKSPNVNMPRTIFWIATILFALPNVAGGILEATGSPQSVVAFRDISFPLYMGLFLGVAKLCGIAAILFVPIPRLKEWAYAGLTFDLLGASYCHMMSGQVRQGFAPLLIAAIGLTSYRLWASQSATRQGAPPDSSTSLGMTDRDQSAELSYEPQHNH